MFKFIKFNIQNIISRTKLIMQKPLNKNFFLLKRFLIIRKIFERICYPIYLILLLKKNPIC